MTPIHYTVNDSVPSLEYSDGSVSSGLDSHEDDTDKQKNSIAKGGVTTPFPWKLHEMLDDMDEKGDYSLVRWLPHGRAFMVHKPKEFVEKIMHKYFNQTKYASFQRQLNLYGFSRLCHGKDKGAYYHDCFVRGERDLCRNMIRQKIKGTKVRRSLSPEEEPDFYSAQYNTTRKISPLISSNKMSVPPSPVVTQKLVRRVSNPTPQPCNNNAPMPLGPHPSLLKPKPNHDGGKPPSKLQQRRTKKTRSPSKTVQVSKGGSVALPAAPFAPTPASAMPMVTLKNAAPSAVSNKPAEVSPSTSLVSLISETRRRTSSVSIPAVLPPLPPIRSLPCQPSVQTTMMPHHEGRMAKHSPPIKGGDLLFFEGQPFRYLEHIEELRF